MLEQQCHQAHLQEFPVKVYLFDTGLLDVSTSYDVATDDV